jgi:hypothetical protein
MRISPRLEEYRIRIGDYASRSGDRFGAFLMQGPCGEELTIMVDSGKRTGWEHVSVSTRRRIPNWQEMCFVKDLFWEPEDCVVQYHPPQSKYVNNYSKVLHLWRPLKEPIPMPPSILVGFKELGTLDT